MVKIQLSLTPPSAENISKMLQGINQTALSLNLRSSPLDRYLDAFPELSARDHVIVHVFALGLPESLGQIGLMLNRPPLIVSQSLHMYTLSLLDLESRLGMYSKENGYKDIVKQFYVYLSNI